MTGASFRAVSGYLNTGVGMKFELCWISDSKVHLKYSDVVDATTVFHDLSFLLFETKSLCVIVAVGVSFSAVRIT